MTADSLSQTANRREPTGLVDRFLRRNGEGGLTDAGERALRVAKRMGAIAAGGVATGMLVVGFMPREVGRGDVVPNQDESITSVIKRGVEESGVNGVDDSAIEREAAEVATWSPGYVNPEDTLRVSISKSPILGLLGHESIDVSKPK